MIDVDGKKHIDFVCGIGVNNVGHSHPKVVKAITDQAKSYIHIVEVLPPLDVRTNIITFAGLKIMYESFGQLYKKKHHIT